MSKLMRMLTCINMYSESYIDATDQGSHNYSIYIYIYIYIEVAAESAASSINSILAYKRILGLLVVVDVRWIHCLNT